MEQYLYVHATHEEARQAVLDLPAILAGKLSDPTGNMEGLALAVGVETLSIIKDAFVEKAVGNEDDAGIKWPPLKKRTIADRRPAPKKKLGERPRGLLTDDQDRLWRSIFARIFNRGGRTKDAASQGAAHAWVVLKAQGAKTKLEVYGNRNVEMLRDTGVLLNSLSPGVPENILRYEPGSVIVGTNVPYAAVHHYGSPAKGIPERRFWPREGQWPQPWIDRIVTKAREAAVLILSRMLGG